MNKFYDFEGFGIKDENHNVIFNSDTSLNPCEIARLKYDGTFIVMGREYKDIGYYIREKEGIEEVKS